MKRLLTPVFLLALLAVLPAGCSNPAKLIAVGLAIEVTRIERTGDGAVEVTWHIANTNVVAYLVSRDSHKVYLNGTYLGKVDEHEPMAVPANAQGGRTSKLTGGDAAATSAVAAAAAAGKGSYRIDSKIVFRIYDDNVQEASLNNTGSVPVIAK